MDANRIASIGNLYDDLNQIKPMQDVQIPDTNSFTGVLNRPN